MYKSRRDEREDAGLFLKYETAAQLGVSLGWLDWHRIRFPPSAVIGCRECYSASDIEAMRKYLDTPRRRPRYDELADAGWYTISAAARAFGVPKVTWSKALQFGRIDRPSHRQGSLWCYTREEAAAIAAKFAINRRTPECISVIDMAKSLGIPPSSLTYHLGRWSDIGREGIGKRRRRWYDASDFAEIRKRLTEHQASLRPPGMLSTADVAARLGLAAQRLRGLIRYHRIVIGIKAGGRRYYAPQEVATLRRELGIPVQVPFL